jgi:hypothetical protein
MIPVRMEAAVKRLGRIDINKTWRFHTSDPPGPVAKAGEFLSMVPRWIMIASRGETPSDRKKESVG